MSLRDISPSFGQDLAKRAAAPGPSHRLFSPLGQESLIALKQGVEPVAGLGQILAKSRGAGAFGQLTRNTGGRVIRPYRTISAEDRNRTLDREDDLLAAAQDARRTGWRSWERDAICAEARALGVVLWPALIDRLVREAGQTAAAP